jgi:tetratricopeptide (TPR) repeat protein
VLRLLQANQKGDNSGQWTVNSYDYSAAGSSRSEGNHNCSLSTIHCPLSTLIKESLALDHFNYGILYEQYLLTKDEGLLKDLKQLLRQCSQNYDELALDYVQAGLYNEAIDIWLMAEAEKAVSPMTYYYIGYAKEMMGLTDEAKACFEKAESMKSDYCFPNRLEDVLVLELAKALNPQGAKAPYYLGCLYYDKRQYDIAIRNWERSAELDPNFPIVWRNLALARFNKENRQEEALECMEKAFHLDEKDSRMLMELDQLYKRLHKSHQERLDFLQKYPKLIQQRDDLVLEEITLLNQLDRYEEAKAKLDAHKFHPWEGGEGKVSSQYQICRVELAKQELAKLDNGQWTTDTVHCFLEKAICLLEECLEYPPHLGEGKLYGAQENDFYYLLGIAYDALGQKEKARECWEAATKGPQEPAAAMYYNDAKPDKIFYQGMALRKLGREDEAHGRFFKLINYGKQHIYDKVVMDYFAVSLPDLLIWEDSLDMKNLIHCKYMLALGYYGMGDKEKALRYLSEVEELDNNHQGIQQFRTLTRVDS